MLAVGLFAAAAFWISAAVGLLASVCSHLVFRRPFLVVAEAAGDWRAWWVHGWRTARRVRRTVAAATAAGDLATVAPPDAREYRPSDR